MEMNRSQQKRLLELSGTSVETTIRFCPEGHSMSWSLWRRSAADNEMVVWDCQSITGFLKVRSYVVDLINLGLSSYQKLRISCWNPWCAHCRKSCLAIKSSSTTFTPSLSLSSLPFVVFHPFDLTTISERIHECQMCGCGGRGAGWPSGHYLLNGCLFDVTGDCG